MTICTPAVARDLGFCGLIRRTTLFSRFIRQARDTKDLF